MPASPAPLWLYAPLWGARFDSVGAGLVGGNVLASVPYPDEWQAIQKSHIADERRRAYAGQVRADAIPPCLTVAAARDVGEPVAMAALRIGPVMVAQIRRAVLTLRLANPGWFLDPALAELTYAINDQGWSLSRQPGPYRQAFLAPGAEPPFPGYALAIDDLSVARDAPRITQRWWERLEQISRTPGSAPLEIALDHFSRSYGFSSPPGDRLAFLFMALEAVLGGFNDRAPGGAVAAGASGKLYRRLKRALEVSGLDPIAAGREAAWLCGGDPGQGRWLRNRIAHGDDVPASPDIAAIQLRAQQIVRRVLQTCVRYLCCAPPESPALDAVSGPADVAPVGAFNAALTRAPNEAWMSAPFP